jgi:endoglucanase
VSGARRRRAAAALVVAAVLTACAGPGGGGAPQRAAPRAAVQAFVRVNQVGYVAGVPQRAYLLARGDESGTAFRVTDASGATAQQGVVGQDLGAWSRRFSHVYAIDLALAAPGTYTVHVDAATPADSPPFAVGDAADLFAPLLANALRFYEAQRDGPDVIGSVLERRPAHLHDRRARVYRHARYTPAYTIRDPVPVRGADRVDVSGGWFDAGDYIKGVQTESYAAAVLLVARRDHPGLLGPGSTADLTDELRFELDWLLRMWDDRTETLLYQVGFGDGSERYAGDHDLWRLPQDDDGYAPGDPRYRFVRHRPAFRAGPPGSPVSPNLAGRLSAAFGLCAQIYRAADPAFADRCLRSGQHLFDLADTDPGRLTTFSPFDYYPETEWHSDLELGAVELALATGAGGLPSGLPHPDPSYYLEQAAGWADAYVHGDELGDTLNLYDVSALAHAELVRALDAAGDPAGLAIDRAGLLADLDRQLRMASEQAASDPFGWGYPYAAYDGTSHGQGLAITAALYAELSGDHTWDAFGRTQLDVILGANAWGTTFLVGAGTTFPHCVHHQVANLVGALDGTSPVLLGAAVNGTNSKSQFKWLGLPSEANRCPADRSDPFRRFDGMGARWWDDARSWPTAEPAIDFVATTPLAFALAIEGQTS